MNFTYYSNDMNTALTWYLYSDNVIIAQARTEGRGLLGGTKYGFNTVSLSSLVENRVVGSWFEVRFAGTARNINLYGDEGTFTIREV